jgi:hypothetical protein
MKNMSNNKELTLIEALCIKTHGFRTEEQRELHAQSEVVIFKEAQRLHLEYQKQLIEEKLQNLQGGNNLPLGSTLEGGNK